MNGKPAPDPLVEHYKRTVRLVEHLILEKVPRSPWMPPTRGLRDQEVAILATELAAAHHIPRAG